MVATLLNFFGIKGDYKAIKRDLNNNFKWDAIMAANTI